MKSAPIILVPGFWLGAWAWDDVVAALRADGHDVTALTLPGYESAGVDRASLTFADHVAAIRAAVEAADRPVVLAVHSATGFTGYAASDRVPDRIAAMVYVDSAPGKPPQDPAFEGVERPLVWSEIEAEENLDGLSAERIETFRERALPVPGGVLRDGFELTEIDQQIAATHGFLLGGHFLIDRAGIIRWLQIEGVERMSDLSKFPSDDEILAAARRL